MSRILILHFQIIIKMARNGNQFAFPIILFVLLMANSLVKKLIRVQNKTTEWQSSRLTWIKGRTTTLMHMDYNASFVPPHLKETHMRVLDIVLLKLLFYGTFCRVGLVALNRKLGFPSREIDIQWKKGKCNQYMLCFIKKQVFTIRLARIWGLIGRSKILD